MGHALKYHYVHRPNFQTRKIVHMRSKTIKLCRKRTNLLQLLPRKLIWKREPQSNKDWLTCGHMEGLCCRCFFLQFPACGTDSHSRRLLERHHNDRADCGPSFEYVFIV